MPFQSESQRRWMWANKPRTAKKWEKHTTDKDLPEKIAALIARPVSSRIKQAVEMSSIAGEEQRKQDLHQLNLQHTQDKHELEMQALQLDIEKDQLEFELKMQDLQQKNQERALQQQQVAAPEAPTPIGDLQYKSNLSQVGKTAQSIYGPEPVEHNGKVTPAVVGSGLGMLAANLVAPTDQARELFDRARRQPKGHKAKWNLRAKGLGANVRRTGAGAGVGLLAGLLAHGLLD